MALLWFILCIVLAVMVRNANNRADAEYRRGYEEGYRAAGVGGKKHVATLVEQEAAPDVRSTEDFIETVRTDEDVDQEELPVAAMDERKDETLRDLLPAFHREPLTKKERAARSLRNLNIMLYVASFLLVAAGALFVNAAMPDGVKLVGVWVIVGAFYTGGLVIHRRSVRLRPAAMAFLGTGLALIPFAGVALYEYAAVSLSLTWLGTSIIGLVAYFIAALQLQSQPVSYLTLAFVLSVAGSTTTLVTDMLLWQFVLMIVVALGMVVLAWWRPGWLPQVFREPIERTGQLVTPFVLVASLFVSETFRLVDYEIIFSVATLYYAIVWLGNRQLVYEIVVRALAHVTVFLVAWDVFAGDLPILGLVMVGLALGQQLYSLWRVTNPVRSPYELRWLQVMMGTQLFAFTMWSGAEQAALFSVINLCVLGAVGVGTSLRLREVPYALIGLVASLIAPYISLRLVAVPALPWWVLAVWFAVMAIGALVLRARWQYRSPVVQSFFVAAYSLYALNWLAAALLQGGDTAITLHLLAIAIFIGFVSYIERRVWIQSIGAGFLFCSVIALSWWLVVPAEWVWIFVGGISALLLWAISIAQWQLRQTGRAVYMAAAGQFAFLVVAGVAMTSTATSLKVAVLLFLVATIGSLAIRWRAHASALLRYIMSASYGVYSLLLLGIVSSLPEVWILAVTGVVAGVYVIASYVERRIWLQLVAAVLTIFWLAVAANMAHVSHEWMAVVVFAGAALLYYSAAIVHRVYAQSQRQFTMVVAGQVAVLFAALGSLSGSDAAQKVMCITMIIWSAAALVLRLRYQERSVTYGGLFLGSYVVYFLAVLFMCLGLPVVWLMSTAYAGAALWWAASYVERSPLLLLVGNVFMTMGTVALWSFMKWDAAWLELGVAWIVSGVLYGGYWCFMKNGDEQRRQISLWSAIALLGLAAVLMFNEPALLRVMSTVTVVVAALMVAFEAYYQRQYVLLEAMAYVATYGLQRLAWLGWPELSLLIYGHWWAAIIVCMAWALPVQRQPRLGIAMAFITGLGAYYALTSGGWYQLLFLCEHIGLLVVGAITNRSWAIWWGVAAIAVATLYFLREYTYVWLGLLGLGLIGVVVWRLLRQRPQ